MGRFTVRSDGLGGGGYHKHGNVNDDVELEQWKSDHISSLTYTTDESDVWRAHIALDHLHHRYAVPSVSSNPGCTSLPLTTQLPYNLYDPMHVDHIILHIEVTFGMRRNTRHFDDII